MIKAIAQFKTTLSSGISAAATTGVLESNSSGDIDGASLPNGDYGIVIDEKNGNREYATMTLNGYNFTFIKRGLSLLDGVTEKTSNKFAHRKGAEVKIVNFPILPLLASIIGGETAFEGLPFLPTTRSFTSPRQLIDKEYADAIASAGILAMLVSEATALTININAGTYLLNGVVKEFSAVSGEAVVDDDTNYVQILDGVLDVNQTGFDNDAIPLAEVTTASGAITAVTDKRPFYTGVDITPNTGLARDANGISAVIAANSGLQFSGGQFDTKLKANGGLVKDADGLALGFSGIAGETLVAGDLLKSVINSSSEQVLIKLLGIDTLSAVKTTEAAGYYGSALLGVISLTENRVVHLVQYNLSGGDKTFYAICSELQADGTYLSGSPVAVFTSVDSAGNITLQAFKRVDDTSFLVSVDTYLGANGQGTPHVKICSVASRVITAGSDYTFGITSGGNNSHPYCSDAIQVDGVNWIFVINGNYSTSNYIKAFSGQIDSAARTITYGSGYDIVTSFADAYGIRISATEVAVFYSTSYKVFSSNFATNVITFSYSGQTNPVTGTSIVFKDTGDNVGLVTYLNGSSYATIAKYTHSAGTLTISQVTVCTSASSSALSLWLHDEDFDEYLFIYTYGGTEKMRRVSFASGTITLLQEVDGIPYTVVYGKQKMQYFTFATAGSTGTYTYTITGSKRYIDYDQYSFIAQANADAAASVNTKQIGQVFTTTGLITGGTYYIGRQGEMTLSETQTINGVTYTNDVLGIALSTTQLLLRK